MRTEQRLSPRSPSSHLLSPSRLTLCYASTTCTSQFEPNIDSVTNTIGSQEHKPVLLSPPWSSKGLASRHPGRTLSPQRQLSRVHSLGRRMLSRVFMLEAQNRFCMSRNRSEVTSTVKVFPTLVGPLGKSDRNQPRDLSIELQKDIEPTTLPIDHIIEWHSRY